MPPPRKLGCVQGPPPVSGDIADLVHRHRETALSTRQHPHTALGYKQSDGRRGAIVGEV